MSAKKTASLCLTCHLAKWDRTDSGRLHQGGEGKCTGKPPADIPIPAAFYWVGGRKSPAPCGGSIERHGQHIITKCPTYDGGA
jgi:hypothetical protein